MTKQKILSSLFGPLQQRGRLENQTVSQLAPISSPHSNSVHAMSEEISLFRSLVTSRRFDDETLAILQTLLVSKDVKSSLQVLSSLKHFLRIESLRLLQEEFETPASASAHSTFHHKLTILDFFAKSFALIGDSQSCLALIYEALLFRDHKSTSHPSLQVQHTEWIDFAKRSSDHGFHSIAGMAFSNALQSVQKNNTVDVESNEICAEEVIRKIECLKDIALVSTGSSTVRLEAAGYLMKKKKTMADNKRSDAVCGVKQCDASSLFRDSIKKRNARMLLQRRCLKPSTVLLTCAEP